MTTATQLAAKHGPDYAVINGFNLSHAQRRGNAIHHWLYEMSRTANWDIPPEIPVSQLYLDLLKAQKILRKNKAKAILAETLVTDPVHGLSGKVDFYGQLHGQAVILDYKTEAEKCLKKWKSQLEAYRLILETNGYPVEGLKVLWIPQSGPAQLIAMEDSNGKGKN